jgi:hypothetical protein
VRDRGTIQEQPVIVLANDGGTIKALDDSVSGRSSAVRWKSTTA